MGASESARRLVRGKRPGDDVPSQERIESQEGDQRPELMLFVLPK